MAYQFNIYPTGLPTSYVPMVNNPLGVTAITDRSLGITEYSFSGIAFYIHAIEEYLNVYNIGSAASHIVSGFFQSIGCFELLGDGENRQIKTKYINSDEGLISGVGDIYAVNTMIYGGYQDVDVRMLTTNSGIFYNTILDDSAFLDPQRAKFSSLQLVTGCIQNLFSGYIDIYANGERPLPLSGVPVKASDLNTHDYYISDTICGLGNIVHSLRLREYGQYGSQSFGIIQGCLKSKDLDLSNSSILSSGNVYIDGSVLFNASGYSAADSVSEAVINFDQHTHDGISSRQITASGLNSCEITQEPFSLIVTSGNIKIEKEFCGNIIGLSSNWEEVTTGNLLVNPQRLYPFGDRLMISNKSEVCEYQSSQTPMRVLDNSFVAGCSTLVSPNSIMGDDFAVFYMDSVKPTETTIYSQYTAWYPQTIHVRLWLSDQEYQLKVTHTGYNSPDNLDTIAGANNFFRLGSKVYFYAKKDNKPDDGLEGFFEVDLAKKICQTAAGVYNMPSHAMAIPIIHNNVMVLHTYERGYGYNYYYSYTPSYFFQKLNNEIRVIPAASVKPDGWSEYTVTNTVIVSDEPNPPATHDAMLQAIRHGYGGVYTYLNDRLYYLYHNDKIYSMMQSDTTFYSMAQSPMSGCASLIACNGRLYTGEALHISYEPDGRQYIDDRLRTRLQEITGLEDPWLINPVVYDGYLWAIASTEMSYVDWKASLEDHYWIPATKIVRRRVAELDYVRSHW